MTGLRITMMSSWSTSRVGGPLDFNMQLAGWLDRANQRHHRRLDCHPIERWVADRAAMPPVTPVIGWRATTPLPRDHYMRLGGNDCSVHPAAIGRRVRVAAGLAEVVVTCAAPGSTAPAALGSASEHHRPAHHAAAVELRQARRPASARPVDAAVEYRNLTDYDRLFGLDEEIA